MTQPQADLDALATGGRTNVVGFALRLVARIPFVFIAGRLYGPALLGRFALAVVVVELAALVATLGLKRGLAQALSLSDRPGGRPAAWVVWDALAVAGLAALAATAVLATFPGLLYPNTPVRGLDRWLPAIIVASAWSDVSLAALAYRRNVAASVNARAIVEPWVLSIAAYLFSFATVKDGLVLAYVASMTAALVASLVPFLRVYGLPRGWVPAPLALFRLARANAPLAGADALEWGSRNVDRFVLGLLFAPKVVGVYYMAQQVASLPQKLKTSFDPILGPVVTQALARGDRAAVARQVRQVAFWIVAAQLLLALMGAVWAPAVIGVVGPQFVAGAAAMVFLLFGEVAASTGAVSETALVYVARHRNLAISAAMLAVQLALSVALVLPARQRGWPLAWAAAGPALALLVSVGATSVIKAGVLGRLLGAPVGPLRPALGWAAAAALLAGGAASVLPAPAGLLLGEPALAAAYLAVLWRLAEPGDRVLLRAGGRPPAGP